MIGEGYHAAYGGPHAERQALADCAARGEDPAGATMYVSLEPCAHTGRQPPCVEALIEAGIGRVVIAADDPSEKTHGRGPAILREAGVEVEFADGPERPQAGSAATALADRARLQNQAFRKHARTGKPHVILKMAASLDGRVATRAGDSQWISSEPSRALVHRWRLESDAVAVGIGTALADDPLLTARPEGGCPPQRQPLRVVFDSAARLPLGSQLIGSLETSPVLVVFAAGAPVDRVDGLTEAGVSLFATGLTHEPIADGEGPSPSVDLGLTLEELGARGVTSMLCEGGPHLAGALLDAGEVDELRLFTAPLLLGAGPAVIEGVGFEKVADATRAARLEAESIGPDLLIIARLRQW